MYLDEAKRLFAEMNARTRDADPVIPCTEQEIAQLEAHYHLALPAAYKEFLRWMGNGAGNFLAGDACYYDALPELRAAASDLLAENDGASPLPDDAFVFSMHEGYQFLFFRAAEGENPPVYWYGEGETAADDGNAIAAFPKRFEQYSAFLVSQIVGHDRSVAQTRALRAENAQRRRIDGETRGHLPN